MTPSDRSRPTDIWQAELETRLAEELAQHAYGSAADRAALAAALATAIAEMVDRRLAEVFSDWADVTAGRAKELLRRSLQGSFRRELKHIIHETLDERPGEPAERPAKQDLTSKA